MSSDLILRDGESQLVRDTAELLEPVKPTSTRGGFGTITLRTHGTSFRMGGWSGTSKAELETVRVADRGVLVRTDQRVVFAGDIRTIEIPVGSLLGIDLDIDILRLYDRRSGRPHTFRVSPAASKEAAWADQLEAPDPLPAGRVGTWAPGFPKQVLVGSNVLDTDPMIVHAAAYLDRVPAGETINPKRLAAGLGIPAHRAADILVQLEGLGHVGHAAYEGGRTIYDPDGLTVPPDFRTEAPDTSTPVDRPNRDTTEVAASAPVQAGDRLPSSMASVLAAAAGLGLEEDLRRIATTSIALGLGLRAYAQSLMVTPPKNRNRMLFTVWPKERTVNSFDIYRSSEALAEFFDVDPNVARDRLGPDGMGELRPSDVAGFLGGLTELLRP